MLSIVGPGGVGGVLATVAKSTGIDVEVVATARTADVINERGLTLASAQFGHIEVPMTSRLAPTPGASVIIATKSYALPAISGPIADSRPAEIISLFNGVSHVEAIHALPAQRVTCGSISLVSERTAPGQYLHHSSFTAIEVEESAGHMEAVRLLRQAGIRVDAQRTETAVLWRKLRFLAPMALLTASTGQPLGAALVGSERLNSEVAEIATASGLPTEPEEIWTSLSAVAPDSSSSLARDVEAGNPTELDALGYDLVRRANGFGIDTPALEEAIRMIEKRIAA